MGEGGSHRVGVVLFIQILLEILMNPPHLTRDRMMRVLSLTADSSKFGS